MNNFDQRESKNMNKLCNQSNEGEEEFHVGVIKGKLMHNCDYFPIKKLFSAKEILLTNKLKIFHLNLRNYKDSSALLANLQKY